MQIRIDTAEGERELESMDNVDIMKLDTNAPECMGRMPYVVKFQMRSISTTHLFSHFICPSVYSTAFF